MSALLDAALSYAARGWRVLPVYGIAEDGGCTCPARGRCQQPGKHPAVANWVERATTDADNIRRAWGHSSNLNVGLATGERSGFFVLDVDPKHGGDQTLAQMEREFGPLPPTLSAITGSGGDHFLFEHIAGLGNRGGFAPGLDVRGDGGQIVAAPSKHMSGGVYRWKDEAAPILSAPEWLIEKINPSTPGGVPRAKAADYWRDLFVDGVSEGGRNDAVARMTGHLLGRGLHSHIVYEIIKMWNATKLRPPLPDVEVDVTFVSICSKERSKVNKKGRK